MTKPRVKKITKAEIGRNLLEAAERMVHSLNDDHEDCYVCGAGEDVNHEEGSSCGDLEAAAKEARRAGFGK